MPPARTELRSERRSPTIDRREFLRVTGTAAGAMIIAISWPRALGAADHRDAAAWEPGPFIRIDPNGTVTLTVPRPDMGQGTRTALPLIIADELDADWSRVTIVQADFNLRYGDQYAGGSSSVRESYQRMREAGATARALLVAAAAAKWSVLATDCGTENGQVIHLASKRHLGYGELAAAAALLPVPTDVPLKPRSALRLTGTRQVSVDAPAIVRGAAKFGLDQRVRGMLVAVIERAPTIGAQVANVDSSNALAVPGVKFVVPDRCEQIAEFRRGQSAAAEWRRGDRDIHVGGHEGPCCAHRAMDAGRGRDGEHVEDARAGAGARGEAS